MKEGPCPAPSGYEYKQALVAKKWFMRIEAAPTFAMLREVGELIAKSPLTGEHREVARQLYAARLQQLKASGVRK